MNRTLVLTAVALTGAGLMVLLPQWRLNADEARPFRQQDDRSEAFRGRGRPGMEGGNRSAMREQVLRRFDEILERLARIERRLESGSPARFGDAGGPPAERGRGPRPPRPEWLGDGGEGFRPGPRMRSPRGEERQQGSYERPLERLDLPEETRRRMEERMERGRSMMDQARERMEQARKKFGEMQERIEALEAEVKRLKKTETGDDTPEKAAQSHNMTGRRQPALA